ncbi:sodium:calcium antiporter [Leptospira ilyithenensis]|uniref:Sodium:calcium antiporter n=1 Tax=Leptospira ilyithenensis TaxID=2484901 RepID=A0A4R9LU40_9LEPT|nr:sodium:calcium antiporter [Leptospira ilyithenensis]TGN14132.1 sodium:calcium antiporter [Leptospira ilyithenensis]
MDEFLQASFQAFPLPVLILVIIVSILFLGKAADVLVDEAVSLSARWGVPKMIIGATIVSLGTTLPEVSVSVLAALEGNPGIALGNAVGSIICDTGLILGIAILISPPSIDKRLVNRQGWIQVGSGFLLFFFALPWENVTSAFQQGGRITQSTGFLFLILLAAYIYISIKWSRSKPGEAEAGLDDISEREDSAPLWQVLLKLAVAIGVVILSSKVLIPSVQETAIRLSIPESIIGATLVAFGTSLPELVTAIQASRRGHSELAVGNIIGADILNVLFVSGAAAAVTSTGLEAPKNFFQFFFPAMLIVLVIFRVGIAFSKDTIKRPFGVFLVLIYVAVTIAGYYFKE